MSISSPVVTAGGSQLFGWGFPGRDPLGPQGSQSDRIICTRPAGQRCVVINECMTGAAAEQSGLHAHQDAPVAVLPDAV